MFDLVIEGLASMSVFHAECLGLVLGFLLVQKLGDSVNGSVAGFLLPTQGIWNVALVLCFNFWVLWARDPTSQTTRNLDYQSPF